MLIVGSRSLHYHFPEYKKEVKDWDFIGTEKEVNKWFQDKRSFPTIMEYENIKVFLGNIENVTYEFEIAVEGMSGYDYLKLSNNQEYSLEYANIQILYSLKKSHIHQPLNLKKHLPDYIFLKSILIDDNLSFITKKRIIETDIRLASINLTE